MAFVDCHTDALRFIAKEPIQRCSKCNPNTPKSLPVLRSELQGWRISCPHCGLQFQPPSADNCSSLFATYRTAALHGEKLLHAHAERSKEPWFAPLEIARLLLMHRLPSPTTYNNDLWRYRILGSIIPDLDAVLSGLKYFPYSQKNPILPLSIRPALLAGVAIVECAGPALLKMLQGHMAGENKNRFIMATDHLIYPAFEWGPPQQMQLI